MVSTPRISGLALAVAFTISTNAQADPVRPARVWTPEEMAQLRAELQEQRRLSDVEQLLSRRWARMCVTETYAAYFVKTACNEWQLRPEHFSDASKATQEEKRALEIIVVAMNDIVETQIQVIDGFSKVSAEWRSQRVQRLEHFRAQAEANNLALLEGKTTWGEYNQARRQNLNELNQRNSQAELSETERQVRVAESMRVGREIYNLEVRWGAMCRNATYAAYFNKTVCSDFEFKPEHFSDPSKATKKEKEVIEIILAAMNDMAESQINLIRTMSTYPSDEGLARRAEALEQMIRPRNEANNRALYNGTITWGEYNQVRRQIFNDFVAGLNRRAQGSTSFTPAASHSNP